MERGSRGPNGMVSGYARSNGPTVKQPELEVTIRCERANPTLTGRLIGVDGRAMASSWFRLEASGTGLDGTPSQRTLSVRTDRHGNFSVNLSTRVVMGNSCALRLVYPHTGDRYHAELTLRHELELEHIHLGDVVLKP